MPHRQQPVQPAYRLGAQPSELLAAIAQQPQAHQVVIAGDRADASAVQGGQADGHRVILAGLAAMTLGIHTHPGGQLRGHIQHVLPVGHQPLHQRPARPTASLHRPAAVVPPPGEY